MSLRPKGSVLDHIFGFYILNLASFCAIRCGGPLQTATSFQALV